MNRSAPKCLKLQIAIVLAGFALAILGLAGAAAAEPRIALVVGNSNYGDLGVLSNPVNDARLMATTLRGIGFDVIEVEDADQNTLKQVIRDFGDKLSNAGTSATGLFYYAGHGLQVSGTNYLVPVHADIRREPDADVEAVKVDVVLEEMDFARNMLNIVILDACRNNPLQRGLRSQTHGLAQPSVSPAGTFIAYATAPNDVAEDGRGKDSPYTAALAAAIVEPGLSIDAVFQEVRGKVMAATNKKQVPWDSSSLTAPYYFVPGTPAPAAANPVPNPKQVELDFWNSIKDSTSAADFQAYLARYPAGEFAALAKIRVAALGGVSAASQASGQAGFLPGSDGFICMNDFGRAEAERATACQRLLDSGTLNDADRSVALADRGTAQAELGQSDAGIKSERAAIEIDQSNYIAQLDLGGICLAKGCYDEARPALETAHALRPYLPMPLYDLSLVAAYTGNFDAALDYVQRATVVTDGNRDNESREFEQFGTLLMMNGDFQGAVADIDKAATLAGGGSYWSYAGIAAYYFAGRLDDSQRLVETALRDQPADPLLWVWKAFAQRARGDAPGAQATLAAGLASVGNPDWPAPLFVHLMGRIPENELRNLTKISDAKEQSDRQCEIDLYVGEWEYLNGHKTAARRVLQDAVGTKAYHLIEFYAAKARLTQPFG